MDAWYSGATVTHAANVCGDVSRVYSDNNAVNSGTGSSNLQGDITKLQTDVTVAVGNPPPVARDAAIWKRVLNAYSSVAGDPTNAGLVAAVRSADTRRVGIDTTLRRTLLSCLDTNPSGGADCSLLSAWYLGAPNTGPARMEHALNRARTSGGSAYAGGPDATACAIYIRAPVVLILQRCRPSARTGG